MPRSFPLEEIELQRLKNAAAHALRPQAEAAAAAFVAEQVAKAAERGVDPDRARATAEAWRRGVMRPAATLEFDDKDIGTKTVADVLAESCAVRRRDAGRSDRGRRLRAQLRDRARRADLQLRARRRSVSPRPRRRLD